MVLMLRSLTGLGRSLILPAALSGVLAACSAAGPGASVPPASSVAPVGAVAQSVGPTGAASLGPAASSALEPSAAPSASTTPIVTLPAPAAGGGRYGGGGSSSPTPKPTPRHTPKPSPTLVIKAGSTSLGTVLVDSNGLTLYVLAGDSATHSNCTDGCASAWPPLTVKAGTKVSGGSGAHGRFGTFRRADGTTQVTYNGKPLYGWTGDSQPGDTTGQGLSGFSVAKA